MDSGQNEDDFGRYSVEKTVRGWLDLEVKYWEEKYWNQQLAKAARVGSELTWNQALLV